jgi:hypothetical protein
MGTIAERLIEGMPAMAARQRLRNTAAEADVAALTTAWW